MGFAEDWADTIRERRVRRFSERGGPRGLGRWLVANPRGSAWLVFGSESAMIGAVQLAVHRSAVGEQVVETAFLLIGAAVFAALVAQMVRGEKLVYEEWLRSGTRAEEPDS